VTARQLIDAGRAHVAAGRSHEAVRCFSAAADDPAVGHEARSMLAAAYLLPGTRRPSLALRHVRWVATARSVANEHLARCALVALCAGDALLAEELAGRAAPTGAALPLLAAAKVRQGDRAGLGSILQGIRLADGPAGFWHRLVIETARRRWFKEALTAVRVLRRSDLPVPSLLGVALRVTPPALVSAALLAGTALALVLPQPFALVALLGVVALALGAARVDLADGRLASALAAAAVTATAVVTVLVQWLR
jgi:hypothetical protein